MRALVQDGAVLRLVMGGEVSVQPGQQLLPVVDVTPPAVEGYSRQVGQTNFAVFADRVEMTRVMVEVDLAAAKGRKLAEVRTRVEQRLSAGVSAGGRNWEASREKRDALIAVATLLNSGLSLPSGFRWRDSDGNRVALNSAQVIALAAALTTALYRAHEWADDRIEQIEAAATVAEVVAIVT